MNLGMETEYVEHKRSTSELREGMESVASILNKHGRGKLYFGVRPSDGEVVGQDVSEKTLRDVSQAFTNRIEPRVYPTVEPLVTEDGKTYIEVTFSGDERPYACDGRYRIRSADEDLPMSQAALRMLMQDEHYRKHPWDREASERPVSDVDERELCKFVERGQARQRISFDFTTTEEVLSRLHLLTREGLLTNAADALFCPSIPVQLKMGIFKTHARTEAHDLRMESGTIFSLVDAAEYYIANNIRRKIVVTGTRTRDEVPEIPFEAIREALMNAYAHRIWYRQGYVQVDIYHDAVDIISPGWFIDGQNPEAHLEGTSTDSSTRNELIATTLFRSGDIESSGMGMRKIRELCDESGVGVTYEEISFGTKLTFHRRDPFADDREPEVRNSSQKFAMVRNTLGRDLADGLSDAELVAMELVIINDDTTTPEVVEALGVTRRGAQKLLSRLIEKGLVERTGAARSTRYRLSSSINGDS
jgi:ATP-dependent DNA helicase RecG